MPKTKKDKAEAGRRAAVNKALKDKPLPGAVATRPLNYVGSILKNIGKKKK